MAGSRLGCRRRGNRWQDRTACRPCKASHPPLPCCSANEKLHPQPRAMETEKERQARELRLEAHQLAIEKMEEVRVRVRFRLCRVWCLCRARCACVRACVRACARSCLEHR